MALRLIENFRALFYAPFYAAELIGAYAAEGVQVEHLASDNPERTASALADGAADVMWGGPLRAMRTLDRDPASGVVCFADAVVRDPFFVIGRAPRPDFRLADLLSVRLATVAEVPTPWVCLAQDLRLAGLDPSRVDRITGPAMAENAAALRAGSIDAVQLFQPYAEELLRSGAGHLWYAAATRGPTAYTTYVTTRPVLSQKRDELIRLTRALHRALRWVAAAPEAEIGRALSPLFPRLTAALIGAAVGRYRKLGLYATDPVIRPEGVAWLAEAMRAAGLLTGAMPFHHVADTEIARAALG
ncbi:MAG TPA: ABC transporter substrate-binding protein [Acetobacteraceae bacterium]|nr:ABC transporter substrate-binding protein [Acetobacteraceae bacterium]